MVARMRNVGKDAQQSCEIYEPTPQGEDRRRNTREQPQTTAGPKHQKWPDFRQCSLLPGNDTVQRTAIMLDASTFLPQSCKSCRPKYFT